jgi:CheY-like chemotaxis protein
LLTAILGNVELALLDAPPESSLHYGLVQIENASQRAAELTRQMLRYAGRTSLEYIPLNLTKLVEEMSELLRISVSRQCRIDYSFDRNLPAIKGDPAQLRQIVMNLLINAGESTRGEAGNITVRTSLVEIGPPDPLGVDPTTPLAPGHYVSLQVSDEGIGMDAATQARIFDPFFTTKQSGRGLGLAAARGIIQAHGGAIRVTSHPGQGSTFEVLFPAAEPSDADGGKSTGTLEAWHGSGTVLLVDDEEAVREAARRLLERAGYTVLAAHSGEQGLEIFQDFADEIRAVILDLSLPGMDGIEVFRSIHANKPKMQVITWSGFEQGDIRSRLAEIGPCVFIEKPSLVRELGTVLKNALQPVLEASGRAITPGS